MLLRLAELEGAAEAAALEDRDGDAGAEAVGAGGEAEVAELGRLKGEGAAEGDLGEEVGLGLADVGGGGVELGFGLADVGTAPGQLGGEADGDAGGDGGDRLGGGEFGGKRAGGSAEEEGDGVDALRFLLFELGDGGGGGFALGGGVGDVEVGGEAAAGALGSEAGAFLGGAEVGAGDAEGFLGAAELYVAAGEFREAGDEGLAPGFHGGVDVGVRALDGAADAPPEVEFPACVETALEEVEGGDLRGGGEAAGAAAEAVGRGGAAAAGSAAAEGADGALVAGFLAGVAGVAVEGGELVGGGPQPRHLEHGDESKHDLAPKGRFGSPRRGACRLGSRELAEQVDKLQARRPDEPLGELVDTIGERQPVDGDFMTELAPRAPERGGEQLNQFPHRHFSQRRLCDDVAGRHIKGGRPATPDVAAHHRAQRQLLPDALELLVLQQPLEQRLPRVAYLLFVDIGVVGLGVRRQELSRLDVRQRRRHQQVFASQIHVQRLHVLQRLNVLGGDKRDGDVEDVQLVLPDKMQEQVEGSLKLGQDQVVFDCFHGWSTVEGQAL